MNSSFFLVQPFFIGLLISCIICIVPWLVFTQKKGVAIIDVFWAIFFIIHFLSCFFYFKNYSFFQLAFTLLVIFWGVRLSYYMLKRGLKHGFQDNRYDLIQQNWKTQNLASFLYFMFQALFAAITCIGTQYVFKNNINFSNNNVLYGLSSVLLLISILGLIIEIVSDKQKQNFKKLKSKGFIKTGLWKYSRHPNYFGELIFWFAISTFALINSFNILSFSMPLILLFIFLKISIPISEDYAISKYNKEYKNYIKSTSKIIIFKNRP